MHVKHVDTILSQQKISYQIDNKIVFIGSKINLDIVSEAKHIQGTVAQDCESAFWHDF
jgi:hypothetical protein